MGKPEPRPGEFDDNSWEFHREILGEDEKHPPAVARILREICEERGWDYDALVDREPQEESPAPERGRDRTED